MLKPGAERLELGGRPVEPVSDDDRAFSKKKLEIRLRQRREFLAGKQRRAERQAAQRAGELRNQAKGSLNKR
jgi:sRNA-binding protein